MAGKTTQKLQIAREGTAGTPETADFTVWRGIGGMIQDERDVNIVEEMIGVSAQTTRNYTPRLGATLDLAATEATYEQLPHLFEMGILTATPAQDASGGYVYTYDVANTSEDTLKYYTIESGDTVDQRVMEYTFAESISLSWTATEALMMSASLRGRQSADLSGGFDTSTTPNPVETILGGKMSFYEDDTGTYPATTQVTGTVLSGDLTINTGRKPKYIADDGQLYFNFVYIDPSEFKIEGSMVLEHDAAAVALIADFEANTTKVFRLRWDGTAIAGGSTYAGHALILDFACVITGVDALTDEEGNGVVTINFESGYSVADTEHMTIIVVNELTALPG